MNDEEETATTSATTPSEDVVDSNVQIKINQTNKPKGRRRKEPSNMIARNTRKNDEDDETLVTTPSEVRSPVTTTTRTEVERVTTPQHEPVKPTTPVPITTATIEDDDDSTIGAFLHKERERSNSDELNFNTLEVKQRSRNADRTSVSTPKQEERQTPVVKSPEPSYKAKVESPLVVSKSQENIEEEGEVVDNDWIGIKSTINNSLSKYNSKINSVINEQQNKIKKQRENQLSIIQERIQALEQQLDKHTELEEFEEAEKVENELSQLRSKIEDIQVQEKANDAYLQTITKVLTEMKKEINLVYSRVDFSFTTSKKDYEDFLKKNSTKKMLCKERLESETNRVKRMEESVQLEEQEFHKRKARITEQIESSTRDIKQNQKSLIEENEVISIEIAELERKLESKRKEKKRVLAQLEDIEDKLRKSEEDFKDQMEMVKHDEEQFQKRKNNHLEDLSTFEKLSATLNRDLGIIESKESKKYENMTDKQQYKDYLQSQQVRVNQMIEFMSEIENMEGEQSSTDDSGRSHLIKEVGSLTQQLSNIKSNLSSISLELESSTQQLQRSNDRLPKLQSDKVEYAKNRKFKEAGQCKDEIEKLTKIIQDLETSIPSLQQEQSQLEEERDRLSVRLESSHKKLEDFDKVESKNVIRTSFKRIDYLKKNKSKLIDVTTPEQFKFRFDVIDQLVDLLEYQVNELKDILFISDEEFEELRKGTSPSPVIAASTPTNDSTETEKAVVDVIEDSYSATPEQRLATTKENLRKCIEKEASLNMDLDDAIEKEEFDMCETLNQKIEEVKEKITELEALVSDLEKQVPQKEPEIVQNSEEQASVDPVVESTTEELVKQQEPIVEQIAEGTTEETSSFDFIEGDKEETVEAEASVEPMVESTTEELGDQPKVEESNENAEESSFAFISENPETEQHEEEDNQKSSFEFVNEDNQDQKEEPKEGSNFDFMEE